MSTDEIYTALRNAGFIVEKVNMAVIVSLGSRAVSVYEVQIALNFAAVNYALSGSGRSVVVW